MSNPTLCSNLILFFIIDIYLFNLCSNPPPKVRSEERYVGGVKKFLILFTILSKLKKNMINNEFLLNTLQSGLTELFFLYFFWTSPCSFTDLSFLFARLHFLCLDFRCCFVEWVWIFIFKNLLNTNFKKY